MEVKRLRVNVVSLQKKLEIIMRILVNTEILSNYRSVFRGKGLEFEDYREYTANDDASKIDWKASARAQQLLIKVFKEERELDVNILLDTSSSMIFGSSEKLKMEYAAEIAAAFAFLVIEAGDKTGLMMFNNEIANTVPAAAGKKHFHIILNSLVKPGYYGGGYNIRKAINFVLKTTKKRGLMIIISDFIGLEKGWERALRLASVKFDVIGVMVRDPRDEFLPKENLGQFVLKDPYLSSSSLIDPKKISREYERYARKKEEEIRKTFLKNKADLIKVTTDKSFIKPLIEYFVMRRSRTWI